MDKSKECDCAIIGGGAAGVFAAICCARAFPHLKVHIYEQSKQFLTKVLLSGGGRCNVTHDCLDPKKLIASYPRGGKELLGPFTRFGPREMVEWLDTEGVEVVAEQDGRIFPATHQSSTIAETLMKAAERAGVHFHPHAKVASIRREDSQAFTLTLREGEVRAERVMLATGGTRVGKSLAEELGHTIIPPVPSLFTFNTPSSPLLALSGVSKERVTVQLPEWGLMAEGPLLITHWGVSGPAVLKLSAWGARELNKCSYQTICAIDWIPEISEEEVIRAFQKLRQSHPKKCIENDPQFKIPKALWKVLVGDNQEKWGQMTLHSQKSLIERLKHFTLQIEGKTTYKEEFVTCGGVKLSEVDFRTMQSRICPGLYFGGEALDIDGVTGGFNFQAAWTTGWTAGNAMGEGL